MYHEQPPENQVRREI